MAGSEFAKGGRSTRQTKEQTKCHGAYGFSSRVRNSGKVFWLSLGDLDRGFWTVEDSKIEFLKIEFLKVEKFEISSW